MLDGDDNVMQQAEPESCFCHPSISSTESSYGADVGQSISLDDNECQLQSDPWPRFSILEQNHDPDQSQSYQHNYVPIVLKNHELSAYDIHRIPVCDTVDHPVTDSSWLSPKPSDLTESCSSDISSATGRTQVLDQPSGSSVLDSPDSTSLPYEFDSNPTSSASNTSNLSNSSDLAAQDPLTGHITAFKCDSCDRKFNRKYELRKHEKYHTRPHKCPHQGCEYGSTGFVAARDLARHISAIHHRNSVQYFCPFPDCKYAERGIGKETGFARRDNWRRHIQSKHGGAPICFHSGHPSSPKT